MAIKPSNVSRMTAAGEEEGNTNYKKQKQDFQAKKTEQMFYFMVNEFKKAIENNTYNSNNSAKF